MTTDIQPNEEPQWGNVVSPAGQAVLREARTYLSSLDMEEMARKAQWALEQLEGEPGVVQGLGPEDLTPEKAAALRKFYRGCASLFTLYHSNDEDSLC